jgi:hypothetical protein
MRQNEEIYKSMLGEIMYQEKIVQLMNKLPGLVATEIVSTETIDMAKDGDDDNNVEDSNAIDKGIYSFSYLFDFLFPGHGRV